MSVFDDKILKELKQTLEYIEKGKYIPKGG